MKERWDVKNRSKQDGKERRKKEKQIDEVGKEE